VRAHAHDGAERGAGQGSEDDGAISVKNRKLAPHEIKALIDDATSGGIEIPPIAFDDMIIQIPILNGEFYPRVNTVNITRGRRIEGGSIGNVTLSSGGVDATAIPLFNTANFVSAFDTTIHRNSTGGIVYLIQTLEGKGLLSQFPDCTPVTVTVRRKDTDDAT
jgi:hypothetical protein